MGRYRRTKLTIAFLITGLLAFGCGQQEDGGLSGKVTIDGSSTVYPISEGIAADFEAANPGISVSVGISGTGGGFKRFTTGETDISDASRPIKPEENAACQKNGVEFIELPVAYDGLTIVVHPENDFVEQFTIEDLQKIFLEKDAATTWQDVNPEWPAEPIKIFAPGTDSGTFDYFKEVVAEGGGAIRSEGLSASEDDNVLVTGVADNENAVGFFGASYYFNNQNKLKAVPIVNPETEKAVLPSPESIENGEYAPFSRPLFIYVNAKAATRPEGKKFVEYYLEHAGEMAEKKDYVALPKELYDRAREHYEQSLTGTHYYDADGNKRSGPLKEIYQKENLPSNK